MRDRDRATRARQQDEQAPRAHPGVSEDAPGDRIDLAEIVQQPAVGPERAELPCERGEVETVEERHQPCRGSGGAARHSRDGDVALAPQLTGEHGAGRAPGGYVPEGPRAGARGEPGEHEEAPYGPSRRTTAGVGEYQVRVGPASHQAEQRLDM